MQNNFEKVIFDIEAMVPWQQDLITGIRKGEKTIIMSGRQTGKSWLNYHFGLLSQQPYIKIDSAEVDGETWYTVRCNKIVGSWIRQHENKNFWCEHGDNMFDIHKKLYTTMILKWN